MENREKIYISLIVVLVFLNIYFLIKPTKSEVVYIDKVVEVPVEETEPYEFEENSQIKVQNTLKQKEVVKQKEEVELIFEDINETENNDSDGFIITKTNDSLGKFEISFISQKKLPIGGLKTTGSTRYIIIDGVLRDNDEPDYNSEFSFSLREDFKEYVDDVELRVKNAITQKSIKTDTYFLSEIDKNSMYVIGLDVNSESVTAFIEKEEKMPDFSLDLTKLPTENLNELQEISDNFQEQE